MAPRLMMGSRLKPPGGSEDEAKADANSSSRYPTCTADSLEIFASLSVAWTIAFCCFTVASGDVCSEFGGNPRPPRLPPLPRSVRRLGI